jgi:hypothetical protein
VIAGYIGRSDAFDDAIASFALAYANQTAIDHAALVKAKKKLTSERKAAQTRSPSLDTA